MKLCGWTLVPLVVLSLWFPLESEAQKVYRIGALVAEDQFVTAVEGFKKKMSEVGYLEDKNIINLKSAKAIGLKLSKEILLQADELIE